MNTPTSLTASDDAQVTERCRATPNCGGAILDGYCAVCGKVAGRIAAATPGSTGTAGRGSTGTAGRGSTGTVGRGSTPTSGSITSPSTLGAVRTGSRWRSGTPLVELPLMPAIDPATAVMQIPLVPEARRFCSGCSTEVGRGRDGRPGRVTGFCSKCRLPFSFVPALRPDDLVAGQYRILGCLAYGGLGWIYLAQDERVSSRWVVLKGLLNASDTGAMAVAMAERQFLARVEHPNVVRIYNVVEHGGAAYIVMEYVGGMTLKSVLRQRTQAGVGPLPLDLAIAYVLAILPAFSYLHDLGLVYNDVKPDNVMLQGDDVKLIDLGAVTRLEDPEPIVYGTEGYEAPEVPSRGPSIAADLYSLARCLLVLVLNLPTYQTVHRHELPSPDQEPLFRQHESFYRFLVKATAQDPQDRYQSADEMADGLEAVLREVTSVSQGGPRPAPSRVFGGDVYAIRGAGSGAGPGPDWRHLPALRVDPRDSAASYVLDALVLEPEQQVRVLRDAMAQGQVEATTEAELGLARALIEAGRHDEAEARLARVEAMGRREWRGSWYRGLSLLAQGRPEEAGRAFDLVYSELPGELAPKLGLALAAELSGHLDGAARHYDIVASADPSFVSACFGLARVRLAQGDVAGAVEAFGRIPPTSSLFTQAQLALARALIRGGRPVPTVDDLARASSVIERLPLSDEQRAGLTVELLEAALALLAAGGAPPAGDVRVLGRALREIPVRLALEHAYRDLAWGAVGDEKIRLVDRANQVRPVTDV
jgi:serine/threonine-protein kinase PknG